MAKSVKPVSKQNSRVRVAKQKTSSNKRSIVAWVGGIIVLSMAAGALMSARELRSQRERMSAQQQFLDSFTPEQIYELQQMTKDGKAEGDVQAKMQEFFITNLIAKQGSADGKTAAADLDLDAIDLDALDLEEGLPEEEN